MPGKKYRTIIAISFTSTIANAGIGLKHPSCHEKRKTKRKEKSKGSNKCGKQETIHNILCYIQDTTRYYNGEGGREIWKKKKNKKVTISILDNITYLVLLTN